MTTKGGSTSHISGALQDMVLETDSYFRPVSKAYVNLLEDRINQLESALQDRERRGSVEIRRSTDEIPSVGNIPSEYLDPQTDFDHTNLSLPTFSIPDPPPEAEPECATQNFAEPPPELNCVSRNSISDRDSKSPSDGSIRKPSPVSKRSPTVHKLLSTRGHLSFDQLAGRLRYFGPTTNCHVLSVTQLPEESLRHAQTQERRTQRILSTLSQNTQDYLMDLFWQYYNSVIQVIDQKAFEEGKDAGAGPFYSGFLHICILAAGYRFADKQRPDMLSLTLSDRESMLHREAKYMLDYEMERPGGIPFIGALLLLGDLEVGCGRDNVGWLYSGMACRLCFDIGLHLDRSNSGLPEKDIEIGRLTLWACVVYDRYWALFLGRPTALKPEDLEIYDLSERFDRLGTGQIESAKMNLETQIYQALIEVMELAGKITEIMDKVSSRSTNIDRTLYLQMSTLDRELENLYKRLPLSLQYTAENVQTAPFSFFLLHQQYYSATILLHRQFARYDDIVDSAEKEPRKPSDPIIDASHLSTFSRETCTKCAGRIAQIFWQHRQRFDTRKIFVTGLQHAGNAATALVAAIASSTDRRSNDKNTRYLECITLALKDMSETYQPAERMATVLNAVLLELRDLHSNNHTTSVVPARRGSSADREDEHGFTPSKRVPSSNRTRIGETSLIQLTFPDYATQISPNIPSSSANTSEQISEKHVGYNIPNDDFIVVDSEMAAIEGGWPIFNANESFAMDEDMANHSSPSAYRSVWAGADTPCFTPPPNTQHMNRSFMPIIEDSEEINTGKRQGETGPTENSRDNLTIFEGSIRMAMPGLEKLPSLSGTRNNVDSTNKETGNPSGKGRMNTRDMIRHDDIWTEIIS
ncbi:hypothetical protein N7540_004753 [Penicillium herquei]|nr:hypothetical protein N7540_004753 [Penicillium herquei]